MIRGASAPQSNGPLAMAAPTRREVFALTALMALGLAVRFSWLVDAFDLPFFWLPQTDDYVYAHGAARIASGDVFLSGEPLRFGPPYFYLLALLDVIFGEGVWPPRVLQALLGVGVVPLVWLTTRALTRSSAWSLAAAAASALYGPAMFFEALLLPEAAMTFVHALLGLAVVRAASTTTTRPWAGVGLLLGAAVALRPNALLLVFPLLSAAGRTAPDPGTRQRRVLVLVLGAALALAPLGARNLVALGTPFGPSTAGINAYIGNGPGATGIFRVPPEVPQADSPEGQFDGFREAASRRLGHEASDAETDTFFRWATLTHVAHAPASALWVLGRKAWLFWNARELSNLVDYEFTRGLSPALGAPLVQFGWVAPLGLVGMLWMLGRRRSPAERALAALLATAFVSVVLVFVQDRYRVPFVPWVIVCAAVGGKAMLDALRGPYPRSVAPPAIGLVLLAAFVVYPAARTRPHPEQHWGALGAGYEQLGRRADACAAFEHALETAPELDLAREGRARTCSDRSGEMPSPPRP